MGRGSAALDGWRRLEGEEERRRGKAGGCGLLERKTTCFHQHEPRPSGIQTLNLQHLRQKQEEQEGGGVWRI